MTGVIDDATLAAYHAALGDAMGIPVERFAEPGVTVVATDDRLGGRLVSHYGVAGHDVVWIDPDLGPCFADLDGRTRGLAADELGRRAHDRRASRLGVGYEHLLPPSWSAPARPAAVRRLDGHSAEVVVAVDALLDGCSDDERDEVDFDTAALDEHLVGWFEGEHLIALAGARPIAGRPGYADVGVIVHPGARHAGRGAAVVAAVAAEARAAGRPPLYRCNEDNAGSRRLCAGVGFERVLEIEAFRWVR